jgi:hypothetical protein
MLDAWRDANKRPFREGVNTRGLVEGRVFRRAFIEHYDADPMGPHVLIDDGLGTISMPVVSHHSSSSTQT